MKTYPIEEEARVDFEVANALESVGYPYRYASEVPLNIPTLNAAQRWLRIARDQHMEVEYTGDGFTVSVLGSQFGRLYENTQKPNNPTRFATYEDGQRAGVLEMIKLISPK
jgi:hypothetical protein